MLKYKILLLEEQLKSVPDCEQWVKITKYLDALDKQKWKEDETSVWYDYVKIRVKR